MKVTTNIAIWITPVRTLDGAPGGFRQYPAGSQLEIPDVQGMMLSNQRIVTPINNTEHQPIFPSVGEKVHKRHTAHHTRGSYGKGDK